MPALPLRCHASWGAAVAESSARTLCCSSSSASVRSSSSRGAWGRPSWSRPVALVMASFSSSSHISAEMSLDLCVQVHGTVYKRTCRIDYLIASQVRCAWKCALSCMFCMPCFELMLTPASISCKVYVYYRRTNHFLLTLCKHDCS